MPELTTDSPPPDSASAASAGSEYGDLSVATPSPAESPRAAARLGEPGQPSRRTVLRVVAVTGAGAALLAACGGDSDETTAGTKDSPSSSEPGSPSESEPDTGGGGGGGLVATADVPVGGGVILEGKNIVVTQPKDGDFKAFTAVCTHQSCTVSSVKNGTITCPCHGSTYSAADGSVKGGPATRPLREIPITVEGDQIVKA